MYGHVAKMAHSVRAGVVKAGGTATIYQVPETLPENILQLMKVPPKPDFPIATPEILAEHDGYLIGVPARYGSMPAQMKAFWDATGYLWANGSLTGKSAGVFVSTAGLGGGQELTVMSMISTFVHLGIVFVPLGYKHAFSHLTNVDEVHGGSPWGAGTLANSSNTRQPSPMELEIAEIQGRAFYEHLAQRFRPEAKI